MLHNSEFREHRPARDHAFRSPVNRPTPSAIVSRTPFCNTTLALSAPVYDYLDERLVMARSEVNR
jgi:hypothetical protein